MFQSLENFYNLEIRLFVLTKIGFFFFKLMQIFIERFAKQIFVKQS